MPHFLLSKWQRDDRDMTRGMAYNMAHNAPIVQQATLVAVFMPVSPCDLL
jgi:hypothetical protein